MFNLQLISSIKNSSTTNIPRTPTAFTPYPLDAPTLFQRIFFILACKLHDILRNIYACRCEAARLFRPGNLSRGCSNFQFVSSSPTACCDARSICGFGSFPRFAFSLRGGCSPAAGGSFLLSAFLNSSCPLHSSRCSAC